MRYHIWLYALCLVSLFVVLLGSKSKYSRSAANSIAHILKSNGADDPYDPLISYSIESIERSIGALARLQKSWNSIDAAAHGLRNALKESSSLTQRYDRFRRNKSRDRKEAAKLLEYLRVVERGMQATEILQISSMKSNTLRATRWSDIGLVELQRITLRNDKISVRMTILRPDSNHPRNESADKELVLVFSDSKNLQSTLKGFVDHISRHPSESMELDSKHIPLLYYPTILEMAKESIRHLNRALSQDSITSIPHDIHSANCSNISAVFDRIRVIGHSIGGAVGAYVSLLLDGTLPAIPSRNSNEEAAATNCDLYGALCGQVQCMLLGPPPCISKAVVPQFITSLVCDDDLVARLDLKAWEHLKTRVVGALSAGAGRKGLGLLATPQLAKDFSMQAKTAVAKYRQGKKETRCLRLPGRVFFMKSRKLKQGATLQRVDRGNWQEDILWKLHDIAVSPKVLAHHDLDSYIRTLNRL